MATACILHCILQVRRVDELDGYQLEVGGRGLDI